jgi:ABC-type cobalamin/Fe3+-siderophores transport system ATPase subunit
MTETEAVLGEKKKASQYQGPTKEEQAKIRQAIKNAKTLAEIARLEQMLSGGIIPNL